MNHSAENDLTQADLAEAFEQGRAAERAFMQRLAAYHHWSSISAGPPDLPTNPYRVTSPDWTPRHAKPDETAAAGLP